MYINVAEQSDGKIRLGPAKEPLSPYPSPEVEDLGVLAHFLASLTSMFGPHSPNDASAIRLAGALLIEQNDEWLVARRYLSAESIALVLEDQGDGGQEKVPD